MKKILAVTFCVLMHLTQAFGEAASSSSSLASSSSSSSSSDNSQSVVSEGQEDISRAKRAVDMRRLARGIQMLRLGKRALPMLRMGKRTSYPEDDLLASLDTPQYLYDDDDYYYPAFQELFHGARYRRSADLSSLQTEESAAASSSGTVKRSVDFVGSTEAEALTRGFYGDEEEAGEGSVDKRPVGMLRLGKRPVGMLRLGKRPMNMLRLGKLEGDQEDLVGANDVEPSLDDEVFNAAKRPVGMLRLGKRPVGMLRLGKRPMSILRLGKRPVGMLRLGKRPMGMLRLGKRQLPLLRLGKRSAKRH